jgi:hypothetical protein
MQHPSKHIIKRCVGFLVCTILLTPLLAKADVLIFKGARKDKMVAQCRKFTVSAKLTLIVDYESAKSAIVIYRSNNGIKRYSISYLANSHFVTVSGGQTNYTLIARSPDQCQISSGSMTESVYFKGREAFVKFNAHSFVRFAKILSGYGSGLIYSTTSGQPGSYDATWTVTFNAPSTIASNEAGDTFEAALAKITAQLESMGYTP